MNVALKILSLGLALVILALTASCSAPEVGGKDYYSFTDHTGREVNLDKAPTRVAILFSSYAEIWQIAGGRVDVTVADSVERGFADADAVIVDGGAGHTTIDTELLVASSPDFVVGTADYPVQVAACELLAEQGIPTALFKVENFDGYLSVLRIFTDILGTEEKYAAFGTNIKAEIDNYRDTVSNYLKNNPAKKQKMLFIRAGSSARSTKAKRAEDHFACAMLEELGLCNIADAAPVLLDGLSVEEIVSVDPEWIFVSMMGESEEAVKSNVGSLLARDGYSSLNAVEGERVEFLPKNLFHYKPNHRWAEAYRFLIEAVYPEVEL